MTEQLLDAYSRLDPKTQAPILGCCTLVVGDGTQKVDFNNGRAQVPASFAKIVAQHPDIDIPALGAGQASGTPAPAPALVAQASAESPVAAGVVAAQAARIRELEEQLQAKAAPPAPPEVEFADSEQPPAPETPAEPPAESQVSPEVLAAQEYLRQEGEEVPEPEVSSADPAATPPAANPAFDTHTADGQVRCQAAKGDGSQCSNPAIEGSTSRGLAACGLGKHQEQLSS